MWLALLRILSSCILEENNKTTMQKFQMTCSCGDTTAVEAENREGAVAQLKDMMNEAAIKAHMDEKHPGQPVMSVPDCHAMIERDVKEAV